MQTEVDRETVYIATTDPETQLEDVKEAINIDFSIVDEGDSYGREYMKIDFERGSPIKNNTNE